MPIWNGDGFALVINDLQLECDFCKNECPKDKFHQFRVDPLTNQIQVFCDLICHFNHECLRGSEWTSGFTRLYLLDQLSGRRELESEDQPADETEARFPGLRLLSDSRESADEPREDRLEREDVCDGLDEHPMASEPLPPQEARHPEREPRDRI